MSRRVLLCDDDPDIRAVTELALGLDQTIEPRCCESARDLLAVAAHWQPDLILLDVMMPGMDGPTVLAHLRASPCTKSIPVVFMTARTQNHECQHFRSLGAAGVVAKPFDPMTLASLVRGFFPAEQPPTVAPDVFRRGLKEHAVTLTHHGELLERGANSTDAISEVAKIAATISTACSACNICGSCCYSNVGAAAKALENAAASFLVERPESDDVLRAVNDLKAAIDLDTLHGELAAPSIPSGTATA